MGGGSFVRCDEAGEVELCAAVGDGSFGERCDDAGEVELRARAAHGGSVGIFGVDVEELQRPVSAQQPLADADVHIDRVARLPRADPDHLLLVQDLDPGVADVAAVPCVDVDQQPVGLGAVVVGRDLGERRAAQQQRRAAAEQRLRNA